MIARLVLALALLAGAAAAEAPGGRLQRIEERGRLIVGVKADYPPWGMVAPDGSIVGLEADLARDAAERLGVELELVPVTAGNRLQRLEQGQVDLVIATLGDTAERRLAADLVLPHYYASGVNLLAPSGLPFDDWGQLRGRPVCLTDGAFFNRVLTERYLIDPLVFPGNRDALMALRDGRCVGWAFDDTVIAQLLAGTDWPGYGMAMPTILPAPWAIAVRKGEGVAALGRFAADLVADWHRGGRLVELQAKWGLPPSDFLAARRELWSRNVDGAPVCRRGADDGYPAACLDSAVAGLDAKAVDGAGWTGRLRAASGIDLGPLVDPLNRARLLNGIGLTLALSLVAIAGSLGIGALIALADRSLGKGLVSRLARLPMRALVATARMTPPILQLYVVFFGLGGLLAGRAGFAPGSFLVAAVVLSLYAGATNAVLLRGAVGQLARERPGVRPAALMPAAVERCYEGLASTSVNIVKAAGLASTIALPEAISAVNTIIAEGAGAATMMNLLLVFYFVFVLAVLGLLRVGKGALTWAR